MVGVFLESTEEGVESFQGFGEGSFETATKDLDETVESDADRSFPFIEGTLTFDLPYEEFVAHLESVKEYAADFPITIQSLHERVADLLDQNNEKEKKCNEQQAKIALLKHETHKLAEQYRVLYGQAQKEIDEASKRTSRLERDLLERERRVAELESGKLQLANARDQQQTEMSEKDIQVQRLTVSLNDCRAEILDLNGTREEMEKRIRQLESENLRLANEKELIQAQSQGKDKQLDQIAMSLSDYKAEIERLKEECATKDKKIRELESSQWEIMGEKANSQRDNEEKIQSLSLTLEQKNAQMKQLEMEKDKLEKENSALKQDKEVLAEEKHRHKNLGVIQTKTIEQLTVELQEWKTRADSLATELRAQGNQLASLQADKSHIENERNTFKQENDEQKKEIQVLTESLTSYKNQIEDLAEKESRLLREKESLAETKQIVERQLQEARDRLTTLEPLPELLERTIQECNEKIVTVQAEASLIRKEASLAMEENIKLKEKEKRRREIFSARRK